VADAISQRAEAGQEARHHQRIGVDDPELLGSAGAEITGQAGQRRIEHRHVDDDEKQGAGHHEQDEPAPFL